jgi:UDP-4-amino-4,6-dideoxy-N-acetyl-beta-L-altrosamine transaminase
VTSSFLPYGRQSLDADDEAAVLAVLRGEWLTQGPAVERFEGALTAETGAAHAVACANGTAALHLCWSALDLAPEDAVIVPAITFLATATTVHHAGGRVTFADVDPDTGLMTPQTAAEASARARAAGLRPRALAPVHFAGQTVDMPAIAAFAAETGAAVVEDACHALGGRRLEDGERRPVGDCRHADMTVFSFHPVKTVAAGEGGAVTTNDDRLMRRLRLLRNHGMERAPDRFLDRSAAFEDGTVNPWHYELHEAGHNYRLSDLHAALADSQMRKLAVFAERRRRLRGLYAEALRPLAPVVRLQPAVDRCEPAWHLAVALIDFAAAGRSRRAVMEELRRRGIGSQVHYVPVHRQPFWRTRADTPNLPGAEAFFRRALSLPLFPAMDDADPDRVAQALAAALGDGAAAGSGDGANSFGQF